MRIGRSDIARSITRVAMSATGQSDFMLMKRLAEDGVQIRFDGSNIIIPLGHGFEAVINRGQGD